MAQGDWYLAEWMQLLGKKQKDIVADLDWNKGAVSLLVNGKQAYTKKEVNALAAYLKIAPHELLMPPEHAMRLRRLQTDLSKIARDLDGA